MNLDLKNLLELMKVISKHNESPIRVEKNLVQRNYTENETGSYTVQLVSSTLILSKTNNYQCSEAEHQEFLDQFDSIDRQKKLYYQICETEEPLASSKSEISVRGGDLGKSCSGPRTKVDVLKNARKTEGGSRFVHGFTSQRQYCSHPSNKLLSCRNNVKIN